MIRKPKPLFLRHSFGIAACAAVLGIASPMVYAQTAGQAEARAQAILEQMTLDEKIDMMHGESNPFFGFYNAPIGRLGIPALNMADGPAGVRVANPDVNQGRTTQLPSPLALAATWSPSLARAYGRIIGVEAHTTNHNVMLGPTLDVLRAPWFGRAFEAFGEDPLLSGTMASQEVLGIQSSPVFATLKHYALYTQETYRLDVLGSRGASGNALNAIVDMRTIEEMYARPFAITVRQADPGAAMCAFNAVNGVRSCENDLLINRILKTQLNFRGFMVSDFQANFSTVASALGGLDQEQPGNSTPNSGLGTCFFCTPLRDAVENGQVPIARINDAVRRILRTMFAHGIFDQAPVIAPFQEAAHGTQARIIEEKAIVLLKNDPKVLPLSGLTSLAVIGADADTIVAGGGSALVQPTYTVTPLDAIRARAGQDVTLEYVPGSDPVTAASLLPGPDPVPSDFLTPPAEAPGGGTTPSPTSLVPAPAGNLPNLNSSGSSELDPPSESPVSPTPPPATHGLRGEYFLNPNFSGTPELDRVDPYVAINGGFFLYAGFAAGSPHFPEVPRSLNTTSSIRWTGTLAAPVAGQYVLALTSTGTGRVFLDDNLIITTTPGNIAVKTETVNLTAGSTHPVRIEYVNDGPQNRDSGPQVKFGWAPPPGAVARQAQAAADAARRAQAAIVVVRDYGGEAGDKSTLRLPNGQGDLIRQVAAANPRTIVVLTANGPVQTSDWESGVPAILHSWYGGQEQGNAIARVIFGDVNPSGRLPVTIPIDDASTPVSNPAQFPGVSEQQFSEGIFVGYRGYEQFSIKPQYSFGHGLSYTTFAYSNARLAPASGGGLPGITVTVRNTGAVAGTETVQVYAGRLNIPVPSAPKALAGWAQVDLQPGQSQDVTIALDSESFSYWDVDRNQWVLTTGRVPIYIAASSSDIRITGDLQFALQ